ncbi:MAG: CocE/NonD family hydrolase [Gammaproteobacteria bacterium]|nr:CocE/NonD family hydrolase [Gammaproteobacteria bacterium]
MAFEAPDPGFWVPCKYVVLMVDVRGQGQSEGDTCPFSRQEQQDYCELISWAAEQPWSNGNVGLNGVSYLAVTQWGVAQHRPAALKAMIPWEGFYEPYHRSYFAGIPEVKFLPFVVKTQVLPHHREGSGFDLGEGSAEEHPLFDDYWRERTPRLEDIEVPALICASYSDHGLHSRDSFNAYSVIGSPQKWLYNHREPKWQAYYSDHAQAFQRRFFDHFLKGMDNGFEKEPSACVRIYEDRTTYTDLSLQTWPPENVDYQKLFLDASTLCMTKQVPGVLGLAEYDANSGDAFFEHTFEQDTVLLGSMWLRLWVEAVGSDDMDLFVGVRKFDPLGGQVYFYGFGGMNSNDVVARGWLRVSHRELDEQHSTSARPVHLHEREIRLSAKEVVPVDIEILPSGTRFRANEKLGLTIQGRAIEPDADMVGFGMLRNEGTHRIHTGGDCLSYLQVPLLTHVK